MFILFPHFVSYIFYFWWTLGLNTLFISIQRIVTCSLRHFSFGHLAPIVFWLYCDRLAVSNGAKLAGLVILRFISVCIMTQWFWCSFLCALWIWSVTCIKVNIKPVILSYSPLHKHWAGFFKENWPTIFAIAYDTLSLGLKRCKILSWLTFKYWNYK